jgi:hypothetical protein
LRVEFCEYFLPFMVGSAEDRRPSSFVADLVELYGLEASMSETRRPGYTVNSDRVAARKRIGSRVERGIVAILDGHPNPLDKADTLRVGGQVLARYLEALGKPWNDAKKSTEDLLVGTNPWLDELLPFRELFESPLELSEEEISQAREALAATENPVGRALLHSLFVCVSDWVLVAFPYRHAACLESTRAIVALRLYELRTGRLPTTLRTLVRSGILREVPPDPFTGKPLSYSAEHRLVWSVGKSGKDDGGWKETDIPEHSDDLVWRVGHRSSPAKASKPSGDPGP